MFMNGKIVHDCDELLRNFSIEDVLNGYFTGELEIFLRKIGENKKADSVAAVSPDNAYLLMKLYDIFDLPYELSDEEITARFS